MRVENPTTWILNDLSSGADIGGVTYVHSALGDHYRPWLLIEGARFEVGKPVSQLVQAAREVEGEATARMAKKSAQ